MKRIIIKLIDIYQKVFSPDHSEWGNSAFPNGYCRFHPTCSEYTKQSIQKHGALKGTLKGLYRVVRCNPWNAGGIDPVTSNQESRIPN